MPIVVQVCLFLVFFMYYLRMVFVSSQSVVVPTSLTGRLVFSIPRLWCTTGNRKWKDSKLSNEGCHCGMYKCFVYFLFTWQHGLFLEQYPLQCLLWSLSIFPQKTLCQWWLHHDIFNIHLSHRAQFEGDYNKLVGWDSKTMTMLW